MFSSFRSPKIEEKLRRQPRNVTVSLESEIETLPGQFVSSRDLYPGFALTTQMVRQKDPTLHSIRTEIPGTSPGSRRPPGRIASTPAQSEACLMLWASARHTAYDPEQHKSVSCFPIMTCSKVRKVTGAVYLRYELVDQARVVEGVRDRSGKP